MSKIKVTVSEAVDREIEFKVSENVTGGGNGGEAKAYKLIESDRYTITLWPVKPGANSEAKKAEIVCNARVTCLKAFDGEALHLSFPVKRLTDSGDLIAGQSSKASNQRGIVTQYRDSKSYELTSIPVSVYKEVMTLIDAALNPADEEAEQTAEAAE